MPMNEYGEIIRDSYPPPEIPTPEITPREVPRWEAPTWEIAPRDDSGIGIIAFFLIVIIVIIVIIGFIVYSAVNKNNDNDSDNYSDSYSGSGQAVEEMMPITEVDEEDDTFDESSEYILPSSDSEYISYADLEDLSKRDVELARNEIYARRGRKFDRDDLRDYFESKSWYHPIYDPDDFSDSIFNEYEKANIMTIVDYEEEKGWR